MDFSKLDLASANEAGVKMEIIHPVTEQSFDPPTYMTVVGIDSDKYQRTSLALQNKSINKMLKGRQIRKLPTAEENKANNLELISNCVLKWENVEWEGKPLPCSYENVKMFLTKHPWCLEQIQTFIEDRANFIQD